jgi:hypothetical protein
VSTAGDQVIVCLRNPKATPQSITIAGDDLGGSADDLTPVWGRDGLLTHVAPGDVVPVELEPFEVLLVSGRAGGAGP